jgi:hypothetical protein
LLREVGVFRDVGSLGGFNGRRPHRSERALLCHQLRVELQPNDSVVRRNEFGWCPVHPPGHIVGKDVAEHLGNGDGS